jgi:hypothetical protein
MANAVRTISNAPDSQWITCVTRPAILLPRNPAEALTLSTGEGNAASPGTGTNNHGGASRSGGAAGRAAVETQLVCAACREANPWTLSCIHTFAGEGSTTLAPFERACEHPHGAEWSRRAWRDVPGPASEHPAHRCRLYACVDLRALSITVADAWPIATPVATRRWLDTKDRRGSTKSDWIACAREDLEFLAQHGIGRRGEARRSAARSAAAKTCSTTDRSPSAGPQGTSPSLEGPAREAQRGRLSLPPALGALSRLSPERVASEGAEPPVAEELAALQPR